MYKVLFLKTIIINGGIFYSLFSTRADYYFWFTELTVGILAILSMRDNGFTSNERAIFLMGIRLILLSVFTIFGVYTLLLMNNYFYQLLGFIVGVLAGLWIDFLEKIVIYSIKINWIIAIQILAKMAGIFLMDISVITVINDSENIFFLIETFIFSLFFIANLMEFFITGIIKINNEEIPLNYGKFFLFCITDCFFTGFLALLTIHFPKSVFWEYGIGINFGINLSGIYSFYHFSRSSQNNLRRVFPTYPQLKEIYVVVQPGEHKLSPNIMIGHRLSQKTPS